MDTKTKGPNYTPYGIVAIILFILGLYFLGHHDSPKLSAAAGIREEWYAGICLVLLVGIIVVAFVRENRK